LRRYAAFADGENPRHILHYQRLGAEATDYSQVMLEQACAGVLFVPLMIVVAEWLAWGTPNVTIEITLSQTAGPEHGFRSQGRDGTLEESGFGKIQPEGRTSVLIDVIAPDDGPAGIPKSGGEAARADSAKCGNHLWGEQL
jgi:hypothetical protein